VNVLTALQRALGSLDRVTDVLKLTVFVASTPEFTDQPSVAHGASDVIFEVLGERGRHARSAVGVAALPLGCPVEVEAIVAVAPADGAVS
jgi:enamine deaminase RidA (YjgF/YER057c/UK114 family)